MVTSVISSDAEVMGTTTGTAVTSIAITETKLIIITIITTTADTVAVETTNVNGCHG